MIRRLSVGALNLANTDSPSQPKKSIYTYLSGWEGEEMKRFLDPFFSQMKGTQVNDRLALRKTSLDNAFHSTK